MRINKGLSLVAGFIAFYSCAAIAEGVENETTNPIPEGTRSEESTAGPASENGTTSSSVPNTKQWHWVLEGALEFGGDNIAKVVFTSGSSQNIKAGQGVSIGGGVSFRPAGSMWSVRGVLGYKYETTKATNKDITFTHFTAGIIGRRDLNRDWWLGAGPVEHFNIELDTDGLGPNLKFKDATGYTIQVGWKYVALTYTDIEYKHRSGSSVSGSNIGLLLTGEF